MRTLRDLEREWHETAEAIDVLNPGDSMRVNEAR